MDLGRVSALHNFYPHPHTGLSEEYLLRQNRLFHRYGIPVGAFAASQSGKRARLGKDFPPWNKPGTGVCPWLPGSWQLGTDGIYIGDDGPDRQELEAWPGFPGRCWN